MRVGQPSKFRAAQRMAAALAAIALLRGDQAEVHALGDGRSRSLVRLDGPAADHRARARARAPAGVARHGPRGRARRLRARRHAERRGDADQRRPCPARRARSRRCARSRPARARPGLIHMVAGDEPETTLRGPVELRDAESGRVIETTLDDQTAAEYAERFAELRRGRARAVPRARRCATCARAATRTRSSSCSRTRATRPSRSPELRAHEHARGRPRPGRARARARAAGRATRARSPVSAPGSPGASSEPPVCSASCPSVDRPERRRQVLRRRTGRRRAAAAVRRARPAAASVELVAAGGKRRRRSAVYTLGALSSSSIRLAVPPGRRARADRRDSGVGPAAARSTCERRSTCRRAPSPRPARAAAPRATQRTASFQSAVCGVQSVAQGAPRPGRPRHHAPGAVAPLGERGLGLVAAAARDQIDLRARTQARHDVARERRQLDADERAHDRAAGLRQHLLRAVDLHGLRAQARLLDEDLGQVARALRRVGVAAGRPGDPAQERRRRHRCRARPSRRRCGCA